MQFSSWKVSLLGGFPSPYCKMERKEMALVCEEITNKRGTVLCRSRLLVKRLSICIIILSDIIQWMSPMWNALGHVFEYNWDCIAKTKQSQVFWQVSCEDRVPLKRKVPMCFYLEVRVASHCFPPWRVRNSTLYDLEHARIKNLKAWYSRLWTSCPWRAHKGKVRGKMRNWSWREKSRLEWAIAVMLQDLDFFLKKFGAHWYICHVISKSKMLCREITESVQ